jgi:hypothetical protein
MSLAWTGSKTTASRTDIIRTLPLGDAAAATRAVPAGRILAIWQVCQSSSRLDMHFSVEQSNRL